MMPAGPARMTNFMVCIEDAACKTRHLWSAQKVRGKGLTKNREK